MSDLTTPHPSKAPFSEGSGFTPGQHRYDSETGEIYLDDGDVRPLIATINFDGTTKAQADADGRLYAAASAMHEALVAAKRADEALDGREGYAEWEALDNRARELRAAALSLSGAPHV